MKRISLIITILLVMAVVKWPIEGNIRKEQKEMRVGGAPLNLDMRKQMPQMMAIALLGGFRGVVANFVWIDAHGSWERQEWFKMKQFFNLVTALQPMSTLYWETSAWHMGWNISYAVSQDPREPRAAKRELARRQWIEEGRRFLEEGIKNIPDKYDLYFHLGWLIMQKQDYTNLDPNTGYPGKHFEEAAERFKETWKKFPKEAPTYVSRMAGHCYMKAAEATSKDPELEKKYWQMGRDWWCTLWKEDHAKHPEQMWNKIEEWGRQCEEKLNLPADQKCFSPRT